MVDEDMGSAAFTPAIGMVDRLDSRGFGPTLVEIAMVEAYLADGDMDPAPLQRLAEQATVREQRSADRRSRDWPGLSQYRDANAALAGQSVDTVFIGDSITEIWGLAQPDLFTGRTVNRGVSGQTSAQILLRFMADVVRLKPRAVHLMCGVNDIAGNTGPSTVLDYKNNILAMLALAEANGIIPILGSLSPVSPVWTPAVANPAARIAELNAWQTDVAKDRDLVRADYGPALSDTNGNLKAAFHRDGLHPTRSGYAAMRAVADRAIAQALRRT